MKMHHAPATLDVIDVVNLYLSGNPQFDGLVSSCGSCACKAGDLAPCGNMDESCKLGHLTECVSDECCLDGECDWHIQPGPRPGSNQKRIICDANLISAVPEMYRALKFVRSIAFDETTITGEREADKATQLIREAISKAEGPWVMTKRLQRRYKLLKSYLRHARFKVVWLDRKEVSEIVALLKTHMELDHD